MNLILLAFQCHKAWILLEIVFRDGNWKVGSPDANWSTFSNPLSSTTDSGLQSRAIHFAREFLSLSDVDSLILVLKPVISSSLGCRHLLMVLELGLLVLTAPTVSVLAVTCFALTWYRKVEVLTVHGMQTPFCTVCTKPRFYQDFRQVVFLNEICLWSVLATRFLPNLPFL